MPTLHPVCGPPALRLTPDECVPRIVGDDFDEAKCAAVEAAQWVLVPRRTHRSSSRLECMNARRAAARLVEPPPP